MIHCPDNALPGMKVIRHATERQVQLQKADGNYSLFARLNAMYLQRYVCYDDIRMRWWTKNGTTAYFFERLRKRCSNTLIKEDELLNDAWRCCGGGGTCMVRRRAKA
jgi:hypothetical protein